MFYPEFWRSQRNMHDRSNSCGGALALGDAITQGTPLQKEVELLMQAVSGLGDDALVEMAAMTLPEDALKEGIWTQNQLQEELVNLQGPVRELVLIPTGQGGFLTHFLARAVTAIKVHKEVRGCGIKAVRTKVENCLADDNLLEAAATLEKGLEGTKSEELVTVWVRHARNRIVAEQAFTMVQAHAIAVISALVLTT